MTVLLQFPGQNAVVIPDKPSWMAGVDINDKGNPKPTFENAATYLRHHRDWAGVLAFDEISNAAVFLKPPPIDSDFCRPPIAYPCPVLDEDTGRVQMWFQRCALMRGVRKDDAGRAVEAVARQFRFNPVENYLKSLSWDGIPRLDRWLVTYCGADDTPYTHAVGAKWMISAVARTYECKTANASAQKSGPGCKVDTVLILEGPQALMKTTVFQVLGGSWFATMSGSPKEKDTWIGLQGKWIIELGELDAFRRADNSAIKNFLSNSSDWFREPYATKNSEHPRRAIFGGSSNDDEYFDDPTGMRRYFSVRCNPVVGGKIDIESLKRDRDQLWAEARARYEAGESWWLDGAQELLAKGEQEERRIQHPWEVEIERYLLTLRKSEVTVHELFAFDCLNIDVNKRGKRESMAAAACLRALGWKKTGILERVDKTRSHSYVPKIPDKWQARLDSLPPLPAARVGAFGVPGVPTRPASPTPAAPLVRGYRVDIRACPDYDVSRYPAELNVPATGIEAWIAHGARIVGLF